MPAETLCCPYCNSYISAEDHASGPVACPRCGESFPYRTGIVHASAESNGETLGRNSTLTRPRGSPAWTGLLLLGGMFLLGGLAIAFILLTHDFRRSNDPVAGPSTALSYMPADANLAAMIRVREVERQAAGKEVLSLLGLTAPASDSDPVEQLLGMSQANLDILLLAFKSDGDRGRPILLVQTVRPYDEDRVRAVLNAGPPIHDGYRTVYQIQSAKLGLGAAWFPATNVIALAPDVRSLEAVPHEPAADALPDSLGGLVKSPNAWPIWLTGKGEKWNSTLSSWLPFLPKPLAAGLNTVHGFAAWLELGTGITVHAKIDCADAKSATQLAGVLQTVKLPEMKLIVTHSDIQVVVEITTSMDTLRRALGAAVVQPAQK